MNISLTLEFTNNDGHVWLTCTQGRQDHLTPQCPAKWRLPLSPANQDVTGRTVQEAITHAIEDH